MNQSEVEKFLKDYLPPHELLYCENECLEALGIKLNISGVAVKIYDGPEVFASSSSMESSVLEYAAYECLERYIVLKDKKPNEPTKPFVFSLSNGVAIHSSPVLAKLNAQYELFERHEILKSWYLNTPIEEVKIDLYGLFPKEMLKKYRVKIINFSTDVRLKVIGVFAFPRENGVNLIYGFGCGSDLDKALLKAKKEFFTRFGFLWEQDSSEHSTTEVQSPLFHQDFYLKPENHKILWDWLTLDLARRKKTLNYSIQKVNYTNLTPPDWNSDFSVMKASSNEAISLFFGEAPREIYDFTHRYDIPHPIA